MTARRFLITLWPFTGHLLPQIAIALALRERGHEVAFYSGEAVRATVEGHGFRFFAFDRLDQERGFATMRAVDSGDRARGAGRRHLRLLRGWLVETVPDQVADILDVVREWEPDAIATDLSLWGSVAVVGDLVPAPVALSSTFMGPLIPGPDAPAFGFGLRPPRGPVGRALHRALTAATERVGAGMRRDLDAARAGYGLAPLGMSVNRHTARLPLYLVGTVPELDYGRRDLPDTVHYVGNCIWYPDADDGETTAQFLERIPRDRPWVHVCESTLAFGRPFLLETAVQALAGAPVELIVGVGRDRDPAAPGFDVSAPNVHVARWLHHGELLPRCSAVITVGGKATVLAAAEAGVPMVVVPTTWDKRDNARRAVESGIATQLMARACTPKRLRQAVQRVLGEPRYGEASSRIARALEGAPGPSRAAELLEALAGGPAADPVPFASLEGAS